MLPKNDFSRHEIQADSADEKDLSLHGNSDNESNSSEQDGSEEDTTNCVAADTNYSDTTAEVRHGLKKEDRGVSMWRMIFKIIMILVAIILTVATYVQLSRTETRDFINEFDEASKIAMSYTHFKLDALVESNEALSHSITMYSRGNVRLSGDAGDWPYVTLPSTSFSGQANHVKSLSFSKALWTAPIVYNVTSWEQYAIKTNNDSDVNASTTLFAYGETAPKKNGTGGKMGKLSVSGPGPFTPIHQFVPSPPPFIPSINGSIINYDISSVPGVHETYTIVNKLQKSIISQLLSLNLIREAYPDSLDLIEPLSLFVEHINTEDDGNVVVSHVLSLFEWQYLFSGIPVENVLGHVENTCGDSFSYIINSKNATFVGMGDAHEKKFHKYSLSSIISTEGVENDVDSGVCVYTLTIYPTTEFRQMFNSYAGAYTAAIGFTMFLMVGAFFAYDHFVQRRNEKVIIAAARSTAIVSSLFPSNVRDRLYKEQEEKEKNRLRAGNLKSFLRDGGRNMDDGIASIQHSCKPLADLFAATTVLFADIVGFTAWSSVREPCQVFILLETLYAAFDAIARRRRIFKVETIGDCYVAVAGLPEPMKDHAIVMAKFANDILKQVKKLTRTLEVTLGPDTGDLTLRIGLHSGPVTAGVLRGERARFQLFGDTVNTAARMEQTGMKDKIQLSQATADYIIAGGKSNWIRMREDRIVAKGKGEMVSYWLETTSMSTGGKSNRSSETGMGSSYEDAEQDNDHKVAGIENVNRCKSISAKTERLVDWNTDVLCRLLKQIMIRRGGPTSTEPGIESKDNDLNKGLMDIAKKNPFDEVKEIIALPPLNSIKALHGLLDVEVPKNVIEQLRDYVSQIAAMYNNNPFHNFEHASHVTMSVTKLLSRIVAPSEVLDECRDVSNEKDLVSTLHDHTYGITSDPLTQFACVLSALIHDVDHSGVPNAQLLSENDELAERYHGKSVAEQNSIDVAWNLLMQEKYKDLRHMICGTTTEFIRFRQLVVNTVLATDIMDPELKDIRNIRWMKAFSGHGETSVRSMAVDSTVDTTNGVVMNNGSNNILPNNICHGELSKVQESTLDQVNRKATIVIEHMIQASDVSHTMQHWHIYRKWNERYFVECYNAYLNGRTSSDPSITWYEGELGFYDYYIIPLAKKLKECGVFGVSSDEYLQYAMNNRAEWASRGKEIVAEMKEQVVTTDCINN